MDKTLPIDLENSCNLDLLSDVTYGDLGAAPMMENVNSGRSSPIRGRTMKEYEQQIGSLKKENFNLKLRIYFLEQRIDQKYNEEDVIKTNIELKVECESYKKDLEEKKTLLEKASSAIDTLTSQFNEKFELEIEGIKQECEDQVKQANERVKELQDGFDDFQDKLQEIENLKANLENRDSEIVKLTETLKKKEKDFSEYKLDNDKEKGDLKDQLESLSTNLTRKDRDVKRLSIIVEDKQLVEVGISPLERSKLQDALDDAQKNIQKLQKKLADKDNMMLDKDEMIGNLEDLLRGKEKALGDKEKELEETKKELSMRMKSYTKAKNSIQQALYEIRDKNHEIEELKEKVAHLEKDLEWAQEEIKKDEKTIAELQENMEKLARSLGKKEGELENFKGLLEQAQASLSKGEDAVEALQGQLERERKSWNEERKKYQENRVGPDYSAAPSNQQHTFHINLHASNLAADGTTTTNNSEGPVNNDVNGLQDKIRELETEKRRLQNLLDATEQTAHTQTHKMKRYQRMLADHGLLPANMQRSNSEQNLRDASPKPLGQQNRFRSMEKLGPLGPRGRSVSPRALRNGQQKPRSKSCNDDLETGKGLNSSLSDPVQAIPDKYSPDESFHALRTLINLVEQLLSEYRARDQNMSTPLTPASTSAEVGKLRLGVTQARCALRSLLASECDFNGRESPDSGCSDNPSSDQHHLKSPTDSPSNSDSADNSPQSDRRTSKTSNLTTQTDTQTGSLSHRPKHLNSTQISGIEQVRGCSNSDPWKDSLMKTMNMTDVFESQTADINTTDKQKHSVRFSEINQYEIHNLPQYGNQGNVEDVSPPRNSEMNNSVCRTLSQTHLSDLTGLPDPGLPDHNHTMDNNRTMDHNRTMDNTMCKTMSRSRLGDLSALPDPDESISTHLLDITNTARVETDNNLEKLNRIIDSYENGGSLDQSALQSYMMELRQLRQQLENQLRTIQMLQEQLRLLDIESNRQITEKEEIIQYLNEQLKDKDTVLKEQNKNISQLRVELTEVSEQHHLTLQEKEKKCYEIVNESRSQEQRLLHELGQIELELESTVSELNKERSELYVCKDTIDEQTRLLIAKDGEIEQLRNDIDKRDSVLQHQDKLCKDLERSHDLLTGKNKELTNQMEEQKLNCADYRKQIEKQNILIKDLKERVDGLREELTHSITNKKSLEKDVVTLKGRRESDQTKIEKLKYNVDFLTTEYRKQKYRLQVAESKVEKKRSEMGQLRTALETSQKLIDVQKLTDDEKHNYICLLLKELKELKEQLKNVIDQNEKITQHMIEIRQRALNDKDGSSSTDGAQKRDINLHVETNIKLGEGNTDSFHTSISSANNTWPAINGQDRKVIGAEAMLSNSLPLHDQSHIRSSTSRSPKSSKSRADSIEFPHSPSLPINMGDQFGTHVDNSNLIDLDTEHFSVPGPIYKQQMTDECLLYNVNDSPRQLASMTRYKIDSDQRSLFAIGMIDHFEKLKKETHECQVILKGVSCRIAERLKKFTAGPASESIEYGTLKELSFSVDNLRVCIDSQLSMIAGFWTSELPNPNEKGELVNYKLLEEKAALEEELSRLKLRLQSVTKESKQLNEEALCNSLESTLQVMTQARKNLEQKRK